MGDQREFRERNPVRRSGRSFARSGWVTAIVIAVLLLGFGVAWNLHQRARFHQLTAPVIPPTTSAPTPGGQEAILLSRVALLSGSEPEFVSATVLPGVGMQLLQVIAGAPDGTQQNLLAAPPVSDVARMPKNQVTSAPFHVRVSTRHLQDPRSGEDLINLAAAGDTQNQTLMDGGLATGTYTGHGDVADVKATVEVTLSGREIDLTVRAASTANQNRFVSFEWNPRFAVPPGSAAPLRLFIPSRTALQDGSPRSIAGTRFDFSAANGTEVGQEAFDVRYLALTHEFLGDATDVRMQTNPRHTVQIRGLGQSLRSLRARYDPGTHVLQLSISNMDPLADLAQRDQTLRPGQTLTWHLRLELLAPTAASAGDDGR